MYRLKFLLTAVFALILCHSAARAQTDDLMDLSLTELLDVEVTSVSKRAERRSEAAAAVYVISNEDIRRSTAKTIPDLLRTVPGVNVAQLDAHTWSVTVRGQAGEYATKLLVLVDGRSVYTPFFSGVFWDSINLVLEDIDRIEIIRGPGGTIWGANAVNGVINIVTKTAADTQGGLVSIAAGDPLDASLSLRYGGTHNEDHFYRLYLKGTKFDESGDDLFGQDANDEWQDARGGFRYDHDIDEQQHLTVQADYFSLTSSADFFMPEIFPPTFTRTESDRNHSGFNVLGRWTNKYNDTDEISVQAYFDMYHYEALTIDERRKTWDIEFRHNIRLGERHNVVWGGGYRYSQDNVYPTMIISTDPDSDSQDVISLFIQDEITLHEDLKLTIGSKFEYNDYTDAEVQPSASLSWTPTDSQTVWAAVSRAVRTPNRAERDMLLRIRPFPALSSQPVTGFLFGNDDFESLEVIAYEVGYRNIINDHLILDLALFYNDYKDGRGFQTELPLVPLLPPGTLPLLLNNSDDYNAKGFEVTLDYRPIEWWTIRGVYSYFDTNQGGEDDTVDRNTPQQQASLTNQFEVLDHFQIDATFRYVDELSGLGIDDYLTMDARLAWRPNDSLEVSLNGRNLLDNEQIEFIEFIANRIPTGLERSFYGQVTWEF